MLKRYQISFGEEEARRIEALANARGIPVSTLIRELALRNLKAAEDYWNVQKE
jgi:predicted DNA-binding protein